MFVSARSGAGHAPTLITRRVPRIPDGPFDARGFGASDPNPLPHDIEEKTVTLGTILLIVLVLMLIGAIPRWSHSRNWGYGPSGGLGLVLVVVVALLLLGRL